jgi:hypothetical protein
MATATRTLLDTWKDIFGEGGFLAKHNVERDEEIEILGLCTTSGVDGLLLGEPGVGKTWMIELLLQCLPGAELFNTLIMKEMSADEVLGPRSLKALKDDQLVRLTLGFMPEANFAYLDEIFKGPPPVLNALLSLMAERKLKFAGKVIDCSQLISIIMSSNELPEREDLLAMRDRIGLTKFVQAVRSPEGKRQVADIQIDYIERGGLDLTDIPRTGVGGSPRDARGGHGDRSPGAGPQRDGRGARALAGGRVPGESASHGPDVAHDEDARVVEGT